MVIEAVKINNFNRTQYNYEGKIKEEVLKNCLNELNVPENDLYIKKLPPIIENIRIIGTIKLKI